MTSSSNAVKLFLGNVPKQLEPESLRYLFEEHGTVLEFDVLGRSAFVYMADQSAAKAAVRQLHRFVVNGCSLYVKFAQSYEPQVKRGAEICSKKKADDVFKFYVDNFGRDISFDRVLELFRPFGAVVDSKYLKCYSKGIVTLKTKLTQNDVITSTNGTLLRGHRIRVEVAKGYQIDEIGNKFASSGQDDSANRRSEKFISPMEINSKKSDEMVIRFPYF